MSRWLLIVSCSLVVCAAACKEKNSEYCTGHPNDTANCPPDAGSGCTQDDQCSGKVCDTASGACVVCTPSKAMACTGTTPVCSNADMCEPCTMHSQCTTSNVCLPDGSCSDGTNVAYVAGSGSGTACTQAMPCNKLAAAVATNKPYIKIAAGLVKDSATTTIDGKSVTILAEPGAKLDRDNDGPILVVQSSNADVKIFDLEITGASGASGADGIQLTPNGGTPKLTLTRVKIDANQGMGVSASGGALMMTRSTITANTGGGISVLGVGTMFDIENNFITYNGIATGPNATQLGGAAILSNTSGAKFAFNTVAFNQNDGSIYHAGVSCTGSMVNAASNIAYKNTEGTMTTDATQSGGGCQFGNSLALGSVTGDLGFKSPTMSPFDFHLTSATPATVVDAAGACTGSDFDGDTRPIGAACDLGADEYDPAKH